VRTEIKNLNSFRAWKIPLPTRLSARLERLQQGMPIQQETLGWDEALGMTIRSAVKKSHDYRYFPNPTCRRWSCDPQWLAEIQAALPELPAARLRALQLNMA